MSQAVASPSEHNVNFPRAVRSEYIKVTSLRSTWILLLVTAVVLVGIAALAAFGSAQVAGSGNGGGADTGGGGAEPSGGTEQGGQAGDPTSDAIVHMIPVAGLAFGQLVMAAFGAVFIGGEYATGMIRSTMTAMPNRWGPVAAKALVLAVIAFIVGIVSGFIAYFVAQPILNVEDLGFSLGTDGFVGSIIGFALYLVLVTLMGMFIALLLRSSALGIVVVLALLLMVPIVFSIIPLDFFSDVAPFLPDEAGSQMTQLDTSGDKLNQWQGGLIGAAWAAAFCAAALIMTKIRDV